MVASNPAYITNALNVIACSSLFPKNFFHTVKAEVRINYSPCPTLIVRKGRTPIEVRHVEKWNPYLADSSVDELVFGLPNPLFQRGLAIHPLTHISGLSTEDLKAIDLLVIVVNQECLLTYDALECILDFLIQKNGNQLYLAVYQLDSSLSPEEYSRILDKSRQALREQILIQSSDRFGHGSNLYHSIRDKLRQLRSLSVLEYGSSDKGTMNQQEGIKTYDSTGNSYMDISTQRMRIKSCRK